MAGPRKWKCTVCGYLHEGDEPPDECPVCKQPKDVFVPFEEEDEPDGDTADAPKEAAGPAEDGPSGAPPAPADAPAEEPEQRRWRCTVCNYIHSGSEPPEVCPVCGAGRDAFTPETESPEHHHRGIGGLIEKLHLHPVMAHFPNGSLPLALVAWVAYLAVGEPSLERTSFYLMMVAMAAAPVTFFSGWSDARHRFGTTTTGVFPEKKLWSWVLMAVGLTMVGWRLSIGWNLAPDTTTEIALYSGFLVVGSGVVSRLGMLGGKLVFGH